MEIKNNWTVLILISLYTLFSCIQKTSKESRQFENIVETIALSKNGDKFTFYTRNFYVFESENSEPFDGKGFFIENQDDGDYLVEPIIRSAVRGFAEKYQTTDLTKLDKKEMQNQIQDLANSIKISSDNKDKLVVHINEILVIKIIEPKSAEQIKTN